MKLMLPEGRYLPMDLAKNVGHPVRPFSRDALFAKYFCSFTIFCKYIHYVPDAKSVDKWSSIEVGEWLEHLLLGEYKVSFLRHDIRGSELLSLQRRDLRELGVTKVGHVKRILKGIENLKRETELPSKIQQQQPETTEETVKKDKEMTESSV